jgi:hypothetical protein
MVTDHIVSTRDKATADFLRKIGGREQPLSRLRRKLGWYKVDRALKELDTLSREFSDALGVSVLDAAKKIEASATALDVDVRDVLRRVSDDIGFGFVETYSKEREGKKVRHVRLHRDVVVCQKGKVTVLKVKKKGSAD